MSEQQTTTQAFSFDADALRTYVEFAQERAAALLDRRGAQ